MKADHRRALLKAAELIADNPLLEAFLSPRVTVQDRDGRKTVEVGLDFPRFRRLVELQGGAKGLTPRRLLAELREEYPNAVGVKFAEPFPPQTPESVIKSRTLFAGLFMPRDERELAFMWRAVDNARRRRKSRLGGVAAARNQEQSVLEKLRKYKRRNPRHSMTGACRSVVGNRELDYQDYEKLIARLSRIGRRMTPRKTASELYAGL